MKTVFLALAFLSCNDAGFEPDDIATKDSAGVVYVVDTADWTWSADTTKTIDKVK